MLSRAGKQINREAIFRCRVSSIVGMLKLIVLVVLALAVANGQRGHDERIVGGSIAQNNQFPHQASIRNRTSWQHICGATIIHNKYFLTAASCVQFQYSVPDHIRVSVGTRFNNLEGTMYALEKIIVHPQFSDTTWQNDIALLKSKRQIAFNLHNTSAINLPTHEPPPGGNLPVVMSGWGQFSVSIHKSQSIILFHFIKILFQYPLESATDVVSSVLRFLKTKTMNREDCIRRHGHNSRLIHPNTICTNNVQKNGICIGDYGGPLIDPKENVLVGIASWNIPCGRGLPDVYQRVFPHVPWIYLYLQD